MNTKMKFLHNEELHLSISSGCGIFYTKSRSRPDYRSAGFTEWLGPTRCASSKFGAYCPSKPSWVTSGQGLGAIYGWSCRTLSPRETRFGVYALGKLCPEERRCRWSRTTPRVASASPFTVVSTSWFFWLSTLFQRECLFDRARQACCRLVRAQLVFKTIALN